MMNQQDIYRKSAGKALSDLPLVSVHASDELRERERGLYECKILTISDYELTLRNKPKE